MKWLEKPLTAHIDDSWHLLWEERKYTEIDTQKKRASLPQSKESDHEEAYKWHTAATMCCAGNTPEPSIIQLALNHQLSVSALVHWSKHWAPVTHSCISRIKGWLHLLHVLSVVPQKCSLHLPEWRQWWRGRRRSEWGTARVSSPGWSPDGRGSASPSAGHKDLECGLRIMSVSNNMQWVSGDGFGSRGTAPAVQWKFIHWGL